MEPIMEMLLGFFLASLGVFLLRYCWVSLFSNGSTLMAFDRFEIWLTKKIQGAEAAKRVELDKKNSKTRRLSDAAGLIFGIMLLVLGFIRIFQAWLLLQQLPAG